MGLSIIDVDIFWTIIDPLSPSVGTMNEEQWTSNDKPKKQHGLARKNKEQQETARPNEERGTMYEER